MLDHAYCSDPDGHDHAVLRDGVEIARSLARSGPFAELLGDELAPTAGLSPRDAVDATVAHYYHPAGTCAMGTVVDERLRVHGVDGLLRRRLLGLPDRAARQHVPAGRAGGAPARGLARAGLNARASPPGRSRTSTTRVMSPVLYR